MQNLQRDKYNAFSLISVCALGTDKKKSLGNKNTRNLKFVKDTDTRASGLDSRMTLEQFIQQVTVCAG